MTRNQTTNQKTLILDNEIILKAYGYLTVLFSLIFVAVLEFGIWFGRNKGSGWEIPIIVALIGFTILYIFLLWIFKGKTTNKISLLSDRIIMDVKDESFHKELPYKSINEIFYKRGFVNKGIQLSSSDFIWFVGGIPVGGPKALDDFLALANKKIEEAKKTQNLNELSNKEDR